MDGIEAAEEIHKLHSIPVIFLTAYSEEAALARAGKAEPHGYILKPFNDIELKAAIEIALYKHQAEEEMRRLNRLYDVLSQVNQAVVRAQARDELFEPVCRLVVERGKIDLTWIGCLNEATRDILPVAGFGNHKDLLDRATFSADSSSKAQGNPGMAIREGKPFICNDCGKHACLYPREMAPTSFGFQSCASFP